MPSSAANSVNVRSSRTWAKKDVAVPWLNPLECPLQAGGIKLRGEIEISILHNHTRNIPPSVVKILMSIDLVPCSKQVRLLPLNGSFEIPTKSLLQEIWFAFSTVPIFQGRLPPIYQSEENTLMYRRVTTPCCIPMDRIKAARSVPAILTVFS